MIVRLPLVAGQGGAGTTSSADTGNSSTSDSCGANGVDNYDWPIHIGGLFIILVVSSIGIIGSIALAASRWKDSPLIIKTLKLLKFFGTGVILATAYIHMMSDAYSNFLDPCITNETWVAYQAAWPGLFAMVGGLAIQFLEFGAIRRQDKAHDAALEAHRAAKQQSPKVEYSDKESQSDSSVIVPVTGSAQQESHPHQHHTSGPAGQETIADVAGDHHGHFDMSAIGEKPEEFNAIRVISTIILEIGIIFHSVIIGITLAITTAGFGTLLTAISFHQLFEGIALGTRIAETRLPIARQVLMGIFYPITTPIGIAVGFGVRQSFTPRSQNALIVQGIFDGLSAGILMYTAYVGLISMDMNHNQYFRKKETPLVRNLCMAAFLFGAFMMSIVGIWA